MKENRKELIQQYKERKIVGCIYRITNRENGRYLLMQSDDIKAARNMYEFAIKTNTPISNSTSPALRADWKEHGPASFEFEILEELEKKETQSNREFVADLKTLLELWSEKLGQEELRY